MDWWLVRHWMAFARKLGINFAELGLDVDHEADLAEAQREWEGLEDDAEWSGNESKGTAC